MNAHPLDRPVWNALTTRQTGLGLGDARARRFRLEINLFVAAADPSAENIAAASALVGDQGVAMVEREAFPVPPGLAVEREGPLDQMVATERQQAPEGFAPLVLGDADAAEMLALATLTAPGPFYAETRAMGHFVGVREGNRLVAMAGERLKMPGFTEITAVCTHPDFRGRGYAKRLIQHQLARIQAQGEAGFLHSYPDNAGAIALYESLGFRLRAKMDLKFLVRV
ncbi:MAG: GNAT family N-acetyltransferase [Proteobacteria bacterium]|nr:GNAT family N-acetyltransferase [Pseudomonadota bacterium]